ncbi:hypothetical protein M885DRAFT_551882 [Pelagophyceae sp. CCMP2097]|nr:hypothetical protein M885DRAFT_551882 [Pelagophyceae sp. CCMP2097]
MLAGRRCLARARGRAPIALERPRVDSSGRCAPRGGRTRLSTLAEEQMEAPTRRQLWTLALSNAVPFIGFGFADNLIMIIAGDAIDKSIGVSLGISTMAAAGIGNLLSDVVGIGCSERIERYSSLFLGKVPSLPLTAEQMATGACRGIKAWASVVGISIGCILGMFPLLFMCNDKTLHFTEEEILLYEAAWRPYGVSPNSFFDVMKIAKWRDLKAGETVVHKGAKLDRVLLVASGSVDSYDSPSDGQPARRLYRYSAKQSIAGADAADAAERAGRTAREAGAPLRGCVIGGTALLDTSVRAFPYPSDVVANEPARVVEWSYDKLRAEMDADKAIEAAVLSILYFDLVEGLRRQNSAPDHALSGDDHLPGDDAGAKHATALEMYDSLLKVALADGAVHHSEREFLSTFFLTHCITETEHAEALARFGWTRAQWDAGQRTAIDVRKLSDNQRIRDAIPALLKQSGIKSRLIAKEDAPTPGAQTP